MSETTYALETDLKEALAMAKGLSEYVRESDLYGRVGSGGLWGGGSMPSLTIGALLMRLRRLHLLDSEMDDAQRAKLADAQRLHDETRREWAVHYEAKLLREANSRLDAIRPFFEETRENARAAAANYRPEMLRRTIVEEIRLAMEASNMHSLELDSKARMVDSKLRGYVVPSGFQWAPALQRAYPEKPFWWLYAAPPAANRRGA